MGLFTALSDASFVQRAGRGRLFCPWGCHGRGYEVRSEEEYLRLRRELAWLLRIGIFGMPTVAFLTAERSGILPLVLLAPLLSATLLLRVVWLTRGLAPSGERISAAEARARLAEALTARSIRRVTGFLVGLGVLALGLFFAGGGSGFFALCVAMGLAAAGLHWSLWAFKSRFGRRSG